MSKFFDETVKARNAALTLDGAGVATVQGPQEEKPAAVKAPTNDLGSSRLETALKIDRPLADLLHSRFYGSDALEAAEESYRALRTRLMRMRSAQGLRSVVITSSVQGEGKTLTALNLALSCAQLHEMRVLLIDGDVRTRGLTRTLGSPSGPGLSEVLVGECDPDKAILATDSPNLYVLSSGQASLPPAELFASRRWQELLSWCNESFKLVVVDSPPVLNLADVELITAACDGVLMVVRAQHTRRDVLRNAARQIDTKKLLGMVYNAAEKSHHNYQYAAPIEK
jgi:capsular exopolysaccharide synthesis family protein